MKINTNIQQFSSLSGIKVTQSLNTSQNKNSEAVNININTNTLNSLSLLSSLDEETFIKSNNNFISDDEKAVRNRLEEVYSKVTKENKKFANPEQHIRDKYFSQASPYYIEGLSKTEREVAYRHEIDYFNYGKIRNLNFIDPNLKDLNSMNVIVESAEKKAFNRDMVNEQFQQLLDKYGIEIPKDTNISFTIDPYDYKVSVSGIEDKSLASLLEDALNTGNNSRELFSHISLSRSSYIDDSIQFSKDKSMKHSVYHTVKELTGYDLRDLENVDGKFITEDGTDVMELLRIGVMNSKNIPEEYKGIAFDGYSANLSELAKKGFETVPDMVLSIEYKNGSFYDVGQSENFGTGKTKWIDELKASKSQTLGEAFKNYRQDSVNLEDKQDIIKDALNLNTLTLDGLKSEAKGLFEEYGTSDMELIKLILMQKYLMGKEDSQADKEFYKLLKEWENHKFQEV
ncbi:DUF4885 family protein [Aliarcobacter skirrowii]|uniref:DUF4885 domain-containing protein n=1 Tax=Aliarcobacter skirrowii TaxID=28200 RepID=A0A2U2C1H6_9BACT|nr:DUF4885 family protein [Aliarcobacter skirrowii]PWE20787.1 hypothetical protein DGF29_05275 [Aliarcobacter skirrowii]PWE22172.1 hypothetical protein DF188_03410 [Aliarcobacter skirrowii]PWE25592.1 hypothetical protein DGE88_04570 [Aliarcobacter skirrowii]RJO55868.1 DUF4885 domain-containing protein [Aliarcobacter skirrowii]RJO57824.1 DUF4885 domain-containing protein [Aliarcobacter skirrowii]